MDNPTLTTLQLLDAVKRKTSHLTVDDARVGNEITERTVRYYVTIGVVRPPLRDGNTSVWTSDHVNDLIRVRRAQHNGEPLKAVRRQIEAESRTTEIDDSWRIANSTALRFPVERSLNFDINRALNSAFHMTTSRPSRTGWMVPLSPLLHLSGYGEAPTDDELDAVREALRERITADSNEVEMNNPNPTNTNTKDIK